jgi:hypothetical protein
MGKELEFTDDYRQDSKVVSLLAERIDAVSKKDAPLVYLIDRALDGDLTALRALEETK